MTSQPACTLSGILVVLFNSFMQMLGHDMQTWWSDKNGCFHHGM